MLFWIHTHMYVRVHVDNLHTCMHVHTHVWYMWHINGIHVYLSGSSYWRGLSHYVTHFGGTQCTILRVFMLFWGMSEWPAGWPGRALWRLHWKGGGSFHVFAHVRIPLPALCVLPHFYVCFQKGEGQERAKLVQKGGVSGRCEDFRIIKNM